MRATRFARRAKAIAVVGLLGISGCFRPETMAECQRRTTESDRRDCIDSNIRRDTVAGAAGGAAVGAIIGAAAGGLIGGGRGALIGGVGGAVTGGVAGGAITYYVEHRNADALEDIFASNNRLETLVDSYQNRNAELDQNVRGLQHDLGASRASLESIARENSAERRRLQDVLQGVHGQLEAYKEAVRYKYGNIPDDITQQIQDRDSMIIRLNDDLKQADARKAFYEERIRELDEREMGPPGPVRPRPTT